MICKHMELKTIKLYLNNFFKGVMIGVNRATFPLNIERTSIHNKKNIRYSKLFSGCRLERPACRRDLSLRFLTFVRGKRAP